MLLLVDLGFKSNNVKVLLSRSFEYTLDTLIEVSGFN